MPDAFTPVNGIIRRVAAIDEVASGTFRKVPKIPVPVNGTVRKGYVAFDPYIVKGVTSKQFDTYAVTKTRIQEAIDNGCTVIKITAYKSTTGAYYRFQIHQTGASTPYYYFTGGNTDLNYTGNIEDTVTLSDLDNYVDNWEIYQMSDATFTNCDIYFD